MNIYFCGMIGSGKTAIGELLAQKVNRLFFDLDREMDRELGRSFHDLVHEKGWLAFRELEYKVCKRFSRMNRAVIALGGGTVRYEWNTDIFRGTGTMILLESSLATLAARVRQADRPRVNPGVSLEEDLERIWFSASHLYRGCADIIYHVDQGKSLAEEAQDIYSLIQAKKYLPQRAQRTQRNNLSKGKKC
ncbi:MAG: shikimate kinase [Deltaproteobacteria bacterium]|nr:MAG: shikimate kinase [Deltaproteobacteria bacterium]